MSSTVTYTGPESFNNQDLYNSKSYRTILLARYNSLEHAEGCRIVEVTGWKQMKGVGQHEYTVVTIERDGNTADVVFERGPGEDPRPTPSLSSLDGGGSSTTSPMWLLAVSSSLSRASDRVTFSPYSSSPSGAEKIWRMDFEDNPPFYMAVNFATTILKDYPFYDVTSTNCYFFTLSFKNMFLEHCKISCLEEGNPNRRGQRTQAGRTMGIRAWNPNKVVKKVEAQIKTEANPLPELQEFRESLERKVTEKHEEEARKKEEELERERKEKEEGRKREEELKRKIEELERKASGNLWSFLRK
ncbi:hypothetical protein C0992_001102 [Termitomyces sp. T32_za158]|nr:hypothetical protein C0992_001102 [Termitomyces sp. T32_za158]